MPSPKYPLQPLLEHRERAVDDRTAELGGAVRERETAERKRELALQSQDAARAEATSVRDREQALLADGVLSVADLARGQAWEIGAQTRMADLVRATAKAEEVVHDAEQAEGAARGQLAQAMADRDVVVKDESRFKERLAKKQMSAEEEQAEEAFRGKKQ